MNLKKYYNELWQKGGYPFDKSSFSEYQIEYIKKNLNLNGKKILDLGCGNGRIGALFIKNNEVYGIDFSESAVEIANQKGIKAQVGDIGLKLPFEDGEFDVVLLVEVMEHVFDPVFLLREISRVLKKDGILFCAVPNAGNFMNRLFFLLKGDFRDYTAKFNVLHAGFSFTEHIRVLSPKVIEKLLECCNFKIIHSKYWFPSFFEASPFNKISWLAKVILFMRLEKIFPNLICLVAFYKCKNNS